LVVPVDKAGLVAQAGQAGQTGLADQLVDQPDQLVPLAGYGQVDQAIEAGRFVPVDQAGCAVFVGEAGQIGLNGQTGLARLNGQLAESVETGHSVEAVEIRKACRVAGSVEAGLAYLRS
jgi:hypothetical protein